MGEIIIVETGYALSLRYVIDIDIFYMVLYMNMGVLYGFYMVLYLYMDFYIGL